MSSNGQNNAVNERTYQEVEYLKKNLGPILVAALAEICIRRPADPIEYLGHWLLRWRYNEELKRRDVQNALEVVRQRQWAQVEEETAAAAPPAPAEPITDGFVPSHPHGPPGFGGPLAEEPEAETEGNEEAEMNEMDFEAPEEPAAAAVPTEPAFEGQGQADLEANTNEEAAGEAEEVLPPPSFSQAPLPEEVPNTEEPPVVPEE